MIENEFKLMLTEEQYNQIHLMYEWDNEITQTNYYYDNDSLSLTEKRITCRVREIEGEYFLQMKFLADKEYSRIELESKLSELPETLSGEQLSELAEHNGFPSVKKLGGLTTNRSIKRFDGAEIDLDKSTYFGKTDYELEIEFTDENAARQLLSQITERLGVIPVGDVCIGKKGRFMAEYIITSE